MASSKHCIRRLLFHLNGINFERLAVWVANVLPFTSSNLRNKFIVKNAFSLKCKCVRIKKLHTHTCLRALFPGLPGWAGTRKVKPIWILLKQETVSGSGISWAICKSESRSRQITMPVLHHSKFFTGRMPFLPPNQQCQSTEGKSTAVLYRVSSQNRIRYQYICPR